MWNQFRNRFASTESYVSLVLGLAVVLMVGMVAFNYFKGKNQKAAVTTNETEKTQQELQAALPSTHSVAAGETLWSISEKYFNTGYNWVDIQKANNLVNADAIEVGQALTIPKVEPIMPQNGQIASSQVAVKTQETSYTVAHGDTLWNISVKHYGTGYRWMDIALANNLANPDVIHAGNVFKLP